MSNLEEMLSVKFKNKRFQVKVYPYVISLGNFYVVEDALEEMQPISFDSNWTEAEEFCIFINNLYDKTK